jgi:NTE family protein
MPDAPIEAIVTDDPEPEAAERDSPLPFRRGYRAMLFHLGALWRLYELGLLRTIKRISSVSGGSITAGVLGLNWSKLSFDPAKI